MSMFVTQMENIKYRKVQCKKVLIQKSKVKDKNIKSVE